MKWNVYYTWQGDLYCAGQYDDKKEAEVRAGELRAGKWNGVCIRPAGAT